MMKYLVFVGMIFSLTGSALYIKEMLKGKAKPNRVSWLIWSIAPLIATFAELSSGVTLAAIPVFMSGFGSLLVFVISLFRKEAYWKVNTFDWGCGILSVLALILWYITKNPEIAIVFSILSNMFASLPTMLKSWKHPATESSIAYIGGLLSAATSFAAIEIWNFASLTFPTYLVLNNLTLIFLIEHERFMKKRRS